MKIAECVPIFLPAVGGTELATYKLSDQIAKNGQDVFVLTHNTTNRDYQFKLGLHCSMGLPPSERIGNLMVYRFPFTYVKNAASIFSLEQALALRKLRPQILHIQGFFDLPNLFVMVMAARASRIPVVITTHAFFESYLALKNSRLSFGLRLLLRLLRNLVHKFIVLSEVEKTYLVDLGLPKSLITVIPNGVDLDEFDNSSLEDPRIDGVVPDNFILCIARYSRYKNIEVLMRAFDDLKKSASLRLVVAGKITDQSYYEELKAKSAGGSEISLLTNISESQKRWLYQNCLFFVLPSTRETSPLSILEAYAARKPVIVSKIGGTAELVEEGVTGYLFDPTDEKTLGCLMYDMLCATDTREEMGDAARLFAQSRSWNRIAEKTIQEFHDAIIAH